MAKEATGRRRKSTIKSKTRRRFGPRQAFLIHLKSEYYRENKATCEIDRLEESRPKSLGGHAAIVVSTMEQLRTRRMIQTDETDESCHHSPDDILIKR
jgi:hypothetical protein